MIPQSVWTPQTEQKSLSACVASENPVLWMAPVCSLWWHGNERRYKLKFIYITILFSLLYVKQEFNHSIRNYQRFSDTCKRFTASSDAIQMHVFRVSFSFILFIWAYKNVTEIGFFLFPVPSKRVRPNTAHNWFSTLPMCTAAIRLLKIQFSRPRIWWKLT